jgi:microcystin-dependent protein
MKYWYNNQWNELTLNALDGMPIGSIIQFAGSVIPTGWLICDGSSLSEEEYPQLYDVIGHTYGGSGLSFNLPNFKGKVSIGRDTSDTDFDTLGETGGEKTHTLTVQEMPKHSHGVFYTDTGGYGSVARVNASGSQTPTTETGGSQAHNNLQPYLVVNYIIKVKNTTPTMASVVNATNSSTEDAYSCSYVNDAVKYALPKMTSGAPTLVGYYGPSKKPIYEYYFNAGALPNNSTKTFTYSLPNFESILDARFLAYNSSTTLPLPYVNSNLTYNNYWITIEGVTSSSVQIVTGTNRSDFNLWCIIKYVATSEITN